MIKNILHCQMDFHSTHTHTEKMQQSFAKKKLFLGIFFLTKTLFKTDFIW